MSRESEYIRSLGGSVTRRRLLGGIAGGAALAGLAACGSTASGSGGSAAKAGALPPKFTLPANPTDWETKYEQTIEAAAKEGEVVALFGPATVAGEGKIRDEFTKRYGVKVTVVQGSTTDITNRALAEISQGRNETDLAATGPSGIARVVKANALTPLLPELILPEVTDRSKNWHATYIPWEADDTKHLYCTFYGLNVTSNISRIYYNKSKVSDADVNAVKSWQDFLDPKWKGKLAIYDVSQQSQTTLVYMWNALGKDYLDKLLRTQDVKVWAVGADENYANAIARGDQTVALIVGGAEGALLDAASQGLPIAEWPNTLKEGPAAGFQGALSIFANAPHPNAARLYVNWILSKEGGTVYNALTTKPVVHLRSDVPQGALDNQLWQRAQELTSDAIQDQGTPAFNQAVHDSVAWLQGEFKTLNISPAAA